MEELSARDKGQGKTKKQGSRPLSTGKYSRLDADISSMQRDSATYCDEPADTADYQAWRSSFDLAGYQPAVEDLITNNAFMAELQARIVPVIVEYDAFWTRYFYRLHLLEVICCVGTAASKDVSLKSLTLLQAVASSRTATTPCTVCHFPMSATMHRRAPVTLKHTSSQPHTTLSLCTLICQGLVCTYFVDILLLGISCSFLPVCLKMVSLQAVPAELCALQSQRCIGFAVRY